MRSDEYDQIVAMPNELRSLCKGGNRKQARKQTQKGCVPSQMRHCRKRGTVFEYPDVVIQLARRTRPVGRRVVAGAVSSSSSSS